MKHTMLLHDGTRYPFDDSFLDFVKERMKDGAPFPFKSDTIRGSDIKRIVTGSDTGSYGPHSTDEEPMPSLAANVFGTEVYDQMFWKQVIDQNRLRQDQGLPWVFNACVNWAVAENRHKNVPELFAFIQAEWETAQEFNVKRFPNDAQDIQAQRQFMSTDDGKQYAMKWRAYDVMWKREHRWA